MGSTQFSPNCHHSRRCCVWYASTLLPSPKRFSRPSVAASDICLPPVVFIVLFLICRQCIRRRRAQYLAQSQPPAQHVNVVIPSPPNVSPSTPLLGGYQAAYYQAPTGAAQGFTYTGPPVAANPSIVATAPAAASAVPYTPLNMNYVQTGPQVQVNPTASTFSPMPAVMTAPPSNFQPPQPVMVAPSVMPTMPISSNPTPSNANLYPPQTAFVAPTSPVYDGAGAGADLGAGAGFSPSYYMQSPDSQQNHQGYHQ